MLFLVQIHKSMEIRHADGTIKQETKDIIDLCTACIALCKKNGMVVTVPMCGRMAYLVSSYPLPNLLMLTESTIIACHGRS